MNKTPPPTHYWQGQFYRIGRHGFVYRWNGEEWIKSEVTRAQVRGYHQCNSFCFRGSDEAR